MKYKSKIFKKENLGKTLEKYRKMHNLSTAELGRLMGVSQTFVSQMERGIRHVSLKSLVRMSEVFDVSIDKLIYDDENTTAIQSPKEKKLKNLYALCTSLDEDELEYVISNIENFIKLKGKKH
ncbi:MAG: helix-turn-helix domain-containing protein [Defluviitaleaceae bacterium]|nr:helix-turn-helix domain-containing protein [Defluviitaleaceae bacterium]